jgi:hypothetical protein
MSKKATSEYLLLPLSYHSCYNYTPNENLDKVGQRKYPYKLAAYGFKFTLYFTFEAIDIELRLKLVTRKSKP